MESTMQRMELLIGTDGVMKLVNATVLVVGVGGVGSYCIEALARSGVGKIIIVDGDVVAPSNLNRQIHAVYETIGKEKTLVMKERVHSFQKNCEVITHTMFYDASKNERLFQEKIDFVVDAIDTVTSKVDLIQYCLYNKIPFISSMGMANRLDPTCVSVCDLMKTNYDPLAKVMRNLIRKKDIRGKIPVVYSSEHPSIQTIVVNEDGKTRKEKMPPASSPFVPAAAGLAIASYAVRHILVKKKSI